MAITKFHSEMFDRILAAESSYRERDIPQAVYGPLIQRAVDRYQKDARWPFEHYLTEDEHENHPGNDPGGLC